MDECKHEKTTSKSVPPMDCIAYITQFCDACGARREREIFNIRLPGLTCCSETVGKWESEATNLQREMPL